MKKRIVIVTEYFYPAERNDAYLIQKISETFSESKNNVDVICTSTLNIKSELETINGKIYRLKSINSTSTSAFIKAIKLALITINLALKSFFYIKKSHEVFTVTNPAFFLPVLVLIKRIKGFKITLLVYDIFPESLLSTGIIKEKSPIYKFILKIYNWAYNNIDRFVVIGRDMQNVVEYKTRNSMPVIYIPNWCNPYNIKPIDKRANSIIKEYNLENKIVFSFVGNFGLVQNIENILKSTLEVKNEQFIFLFIGDGAMKYKIINFIDKFNCKNIIYAGKYPSCEQNEFLNACDVSVISLEKSMYGLGVPSKSYYNMAAQKPLFFIGHKESEIAQVIIENNIGWVCEPDNISQLAKMFDFICESKDDFVLKGKKSREICLNKYNEEIILEKYKDLYTN